MSQQPTIKTERLILRPYNLGDAPELQRLIGERDVVSTMTNVPHPYEDGMAEEWIGERKESFKKGKTVDFAITHRQEGFFIFASENPIEFTVLKVAPFLEVLAVAAFVFHADFLHDSSRGWVAPEVLGMNTVQPQYFKSVLKDGTGCLGAVAFSPVGLANPVADFGKLGLLVNVVEAYTAYEKAPNP